MTTKIRFFQGAAPHSGRLGIFPGAFNPVTRAHLAVAQAARDQYGLQQVVFLLPQIFPHKEYEGTSFDERVTLLAEALQSDPSMAVASSEGGLFIEIAREFRSACGGGVELYLVCGCDAAERIVHWDYGRELPFARQLEQFQMLVAAREREYIVPSEYATRIHPVRMPPDYHEVSSSAVRKAIEQGYAWEDLVPESVARQIREKRLYGA